ncbi:MAG TPA: winged helix-turn-helix domain-containing protein [Nitrososphaeraceae archaeon]|nr:winged helix-turn-helix domain-containing protein [Nitrososphaeraceae archaeon]
MKHRSKEEIAALVLEAIVNTHRPTQTMIMYKAYLTHVQLKEFLASLMEMGLIEYHKLERIYTITEKGMHFLEVYNQLNQLQTSNFLKTTTSTNLPTIEPTEVSNQQSSSYLATITRTNNRWKCEKCLVPFANLKLLKLHKEEYHSY